MRLEKTKISLKEKILLAVVLNVDEQDFIPYGEFVFPFNSGIGVDELYRWVSATRTVFFSTVSRMVKENLLEKERGMIKISNAGKQFLAESFPQIFLRKKNWDGNWRIIVFDINEKDRYKRDKFRNYLLKLKFLPLSEGVFATPLYAFPYVKKYCEVHGLSDLIVYIEGKVENETASKFIVSHKIDEINLEYARLCNALKTALNLHDHDTIPFLKSQFLEVYAKDPHLCDELLPNNWFGRRALKMFSKA